jgi:hypothetical protein
MLVYRPHRRSKHGQTQRKGATDNPCTAPPAHRGSCAFVVIKVETSSSTDSAAVNREVPYTRPCFHSVDRPVVALDLLRVALNSRPT